MPEELISLKDDVLALGVWADDGAFAALSANRDTVAAGLIGEGLPDDPPPPPPVDEVGTVEGGGLLLGGSGGGLELLLP